MDSSLELVACGLWPCVSTPDLSKVKEKQLHTRGIETWKSLLHTAMPVEPVLVGLAEELYYTLHLKQTAQFSTTSGDIVSNKSR